MSNNNLEKVDFSSMTKDEVIAYFVKENTDLKQKNLQLEQDKAQLVQDAKRQARDIKRLERKSQKLEDNSTFPARNLG